MYTFIDDMTNNTLGVRLTGIINGDDIDAISEKLDDAIMNHDQIRLLVVLEQFEGWQGGAIFKLGQFFLANRGKITRMALMSAETESKPIDDIVSFLSGIEVERFSEESTARNWLQEDSAHWSVDPSRYNADVRYPQDMRVLIVGAGIAGLTLSAMLQQRGIQPIMVEQAPEFGHLGYVLILMSAGARVLKGLGVYEQLYEAGVMMRHYDVADTSGEMLRSHDIADRFAPLFDDSFSIYRPALVDVIRSATDTSNLRMGTTVDAIEQSNDEVHVTFSDGTQDTFDLVVGADGITSKVRELVFGEINMMYSGLHGWAWWGEPQDAFDQRALEHWGDEGAFGLYPTQDRLCVVAVSKTEAGQPDDPAERKQRIRQRFGDWQGEWVQHGLSELDNIAAEDIYTDDFYYSDYPHWYRGRVVLAGDAIHAFSPISGLGASMAMESAAVLAEELCYADSRFIDQALRKYQQRRQERVSLIRKQARLFGDVATSDHPAVDATRRWALRYLDDGPIHHFLARIPYKPV